MAKRFLRNKNKEACRRDSLLMPLNNDASVRSGGGWL